jgi:hypothetical protein
VISGAGGPGAAIFAEAFPLDGCPAPALTVFAAMLARGLPLFRPDRPPCLPRLAPSPAPHATQPVSSEHCAPSILPFEGRVCVPCLRSPCEHGFEGDGNPPLPPPPPDCWPARSRAFPADRMGAHSFGGIDLAVCFLQLAVRRVCKPTLGRLAADDRTPPHHRACQRCPAPGACGRRFSMLLPGALDEVSRAALFLIE